jgi:hypothetical protein
MLASMASIALWRSSALVLLCRALICGSFL